jgi:hypothetical protein
MQGRKMTNYVFTGLNEKYWAHFGSSWIYSLREVAQYKGEVVVIDFGLLDSSKNKLKEKEVKIIESKEEEKEDIRRKTLQEIASFSKKNKGNFVYWDADVFFEGNIDQVFNEINDKIILTQNKNPGFVGGPYYQWAFIEDTIRLMSLAKQKTSSTAVIECLNNHFGKFLNHVSNTWNFTDLTQIDTKKIDVDGEKPKVMHPTGVLKSLLENSGFLFHNRQNEGYLRFVENKSINFRKLIKKST